MLISILLANSFYGLAQGGSREYEKRIFFNFVGRIRYSDYSFSHSDFIRMTKAAKQTKLSKIPSDCKHLFQEGACCTATDSSKGFIFSRCNDDNLKILRNGCYSFTLYIKNDSVVDCYYVYPPDTNSQIVDIDQLNLFINLIRPNGYYELQEYGYSIFKRGRKVNRKYRKILKDYFVNESGRYASDNFDRFVFFHNKDFNVELYINKKTKQIELFEAAGENE